MKGTYNSLKNNWGLLLLALALLIAYGIPIIIDNMSLFNAKWLDKAISHWLSAPMASAVHQAFMEGEFPLWNPYNGVGAPLLIELQNAMYSPFHWFAFANPSDRTWDFIILLRFFVSGTGVILFLRACGIRYWISAFTGLLYMFSGHLYYFGNAWHINSLALAPFLLYGIQEFFNNRLRIATFVISLSWCFIITGGGLIDAFLLGVLSLMVIVANLRRFLLDKQNLSRLGYILFLFLLGTLISSIFLIPLLELRSVTAPPYPGRSLARFNSLAYFLSLFFHKLTVTPSDISHYYMKFRQYFNILILPGIVWSILYFRQGTRNQRSWTITFSIFIFLYFGKLYGFPFLQVLDHLPFFKEVRFEKYVGTSYLLLYLLAGFGFEWMLSDKAKGKLKSSVSIIKVYGTAMIIAIAPFLYNLPVENHIAPFLHTLAMKNYISTTRLYVFGYGMCILLFCSLMFFHQKKKHTTTVVLIFLIGIIAIKQDMRSDFLGKMSYFTSTPEEVKQLVDKNSLKNPMRVLFDTRYPPKMGLSHKLSDVRDYSDSLQNRYYQLFKNKALKGKTWNRFVLMSKDYPNWNHDILSFLNVGYLVVSGHPVQPYKRLKNENIFYNPETFPRASFVYNVEFGISPETILDTITNNTDYFRKTAMLEEVPNFELNDSPLDGDQSYNLRFTKYTFNEVMIELETNHPGMLVLSDQYYPGWKVKVNGKQGEIYQANYLFRGVYLKKGNHNVHFYYKPLSFRLGLMITIITLILLFIILQKRIQTRICKLLGIYSGI